MFNRDFVHYCYELYDHHGTIMSYNGQQNDIICYPRPYCLQFVIIAQLHILALMTC
jgi:hypothetical protein